jgi:hypothetical protein
VITIIKDGARLLLGYRAERADISWVDHCLAEDGFVSLAGKTFILKTADLLPIEAPSGMPDDDTRAFLLGALENDYYLIRADILKLRHDLRLHKEMRLNHKTFTAYRDISIFAKIDSLIDEPIIVGGEAEGAITLEEFEYLLKVFPNSTELTHYACSRITRILKDYFNTMSDAQQRLNTYLARRESRLQAEAGEERQPYHDVRSQILLPYEQEKFRYVHDQLTDMLQNTGSYPEEDWQRIIVSFLCLIFPKYIAVLQNVQIKDFYTNPQRVRNRYIDIALVDAVGALDVVEIKKPFARSLLSAGKYRDNYTPKKEMAGSIMQVEKYLFHLSKWGHAGEKAIWEHRSAELPNGFKIKITNPRGLVILGRDNDFQEHQQWLDFEIIRRKYANMMDIITYDDLLRRLDNIISMLRRPIALPGTQGGQQ